MLEIIITAQKSGGGFSWEPEGDDFKNFRYFQVYTALYKFIDTTSFYFAYRTSTFP